MIILNPDLKIYYSTKINDDYFFSGFSTRHLGDGRNIGNIIQFLQQNEIDYRKLVILGQIHSANVAYFDSNKDVSVEKIEDTDGIITNKEKIVLTINTADCLPMVFVDKKAGLVGVSHQGWRGSIKKLPVKMVEEMMLHGADKQEIIVSIGPGIGSCCYDVDDDRYYSFLEEFDGYSEKIFRIWRGKRYLNLMLLNYLLLVDV